MHHQKRAGDFLHYAVQAKAFEFFHRFIARFDVEYPQQMLPRHRQRRQLAAVEFFKAGAPDFPVVPLRAPGDAGGEALLKGRRARRVVAAEADRHNANALGVDLLARGEKFVGRCAVAFGFVMQPLIAKAHGLAVAGAIDDEAGDAARGEVGHAFEILNLFGDIKAVEEHHRGCWPLVPHVFRVDQDRGQ